MRTILKAHMFAVLVIGTFLGLLPWLAIVIFGYGRLQLNSTVAITLGVILAAAGASLSYSCMIVFIARGRGTAFPTDPPKEFVAAGPYRYTRNPMYVGNIIGGIGIGFLLQSGTYLVYVVVLAVVCHLYIVRSEEPALRVRFGDSYKDYCAKINRWLPSKPYVSLKRDDIEAPAEGR
jgi:protein-S-isoprenylcysteine O-methyltransferase Ste14